ncbi:MAG: type IV pilus assembly protein PilM [Bdellovibrio sp.]
MDNKQLINKIKSSIEGFTDALSIRKKSLIGLDIGLSSVKIAEVSFNGKEYTLQRYASVPLPEGAIIEDEIQKQEEIVEAIKECYSKSGCKSNWVCLGIAGPNTVARKLTMAGGSREEIEDQVMWEAEQYLPFNIDDSNISFHLIGENEGGGVDLIITASKKDTVLNFKNLVDSAGLKTKIVEIGAVSVVNVFEVVMRDQIQDPAESWMILDLGAQKTEFIIYKNNMPIFFKEINVGGVMITEEIQRQLGVNYYEAEDLKITGDENGNLPEEILQIVDDVVETFFTEIKKTIDFYVSSTSDESLVGCCVTGGSALIPGLVEGLESLLGVKVSALNPFDKITVNTSNIEEEMIDSIMYKGVQVIGQALRKF